MPRIYFPQRQMKKLFKKAPNTSRIALAIILFGTALMISAIVNKGFIKHYFPYMGCILLIIATWFLYRTENKSLRELGLDLRLRNILFFPLGLFLAALVFLIARYVRALYFGEDVIISEEVDKQLILIAFYTILPQVAVEELLFRGYLFKKTVTLSNVVFANVLFSFLFVLIHVLDEDVLRNKGMLVMLIISIPVGHLLFATALLKSRSLFFPIGLHLGHNWASRHLIHNVNSDASIFYISNAVTFESWPPFIWSILLYNGLFILLTLIIWKWSKITHKLGIRRVDE